MPELDLKEIKTVLGMDLSLNHCGVVRLDMDKENYCNWFGLSNNKIESDQEMITYYPAKKKEDDKSIYNAHRLCLVSEFVINSIEEGIALGKLGKLFCLEDYAFGARSSSVTGLAELGGITKNYLFDYRIPYRTVDPLTVKLYATGNGHATKTMMLNAIIEIRKNPFPKSLFRTEKKKGKVDLTGVGTDLVDAYWLAHLLRTEIRLRLGYIDLKDLPEKQRNIFLRVTKANPVNILARPFIYDDGRYD